MALSVGRPRLPAIRRSRGGSRPSDDPLASMALWLPRLLGSGTVAASAIRAALGALGTGAALAECMADATAAACGHVVERSGATRYRVILSIDSTWCAVAATDYPDVLTAGTTAWHGVTPEPGPEDKAGEAGLEFHRTPDGHLRVRCRVAMHGSLWAGASAGAPAGVRSS